MWSQWSEENDQSSSSWQEGYSNSPNYSMQKWWPEPQQFGKDWKTVPVFTSPAWVIPILVWHQRNLMQSSAVYFNVRSVCFLRAFLLTTVIKCGHKISVTSLTLHLWPLSSVRPFSPAELKFVTCICKISCTTWSMVWIIAQMCRCTHVRKGQRHFLKHMYLFTVMWKIIKIPKQIRLD